MNKFTNVNEFMQSLSASQKEQVETLRQIILHTNKTLSEHIKWNSPSYVLNDEDRITFNVRETQPIAIVLHMGATKTEDKSGAPVLNDYSDLIEWKSNIRGVIVFSSLEDIHNKKERFALVIQDWLALE